jgi:hypothetical protein
MHVAKLKVVFGCLIVIFLYFLVKASIGSLDIWKMFCNLLLIHLKQIFKV